MVKIPDKSALVFFVVVLVALVGLSSVFYSAGITGEFNRQTHPGLVKYVSCHYKDFDKYGECMRTERQEGVSCSPAEDVPRIAQRGPRPEHTTGSFWRPCGNDRKF